MFLTDYFACSLPQQLCTLEDQENARCTADQQRDANTNCHLYSTEIVKQRFHIASADATLLRG